MGFYRRLPASGSADEDRVPRHSAGDSRRFRSSGHWWVFWC